MDDNEEMPLPLAHISDDERAQGTQELHAAVNDLNNPLSTTVPFLNAVRALGTQDEAVAWETLRATTLRLSDWGDFSETREAIGSLGLATGVQYSTERPDELAYIKLIDAGNRTVRAFDTAVVPDAIMLTLVRPDPRGPWLVFAVTPGSGLPASRVFTD